MTNVVLLPTVTPLGHDPDALLQVAGGQMAEVVIIGFTKDGDEYFSSSVADGGSVLWHLERAKLKLLNIVERLEEQP